LIARAVKADPELIQGWWALAHLLDDEKQQIYCLKQVLRLDPTHQKARATLDALIGEPEKPPSVSKPTSQIGPERRSPAREVPISPGSAAQNDEQTTHSAVQSRSSKGIWIGAIAAISLVLVGVALAFLVVAGVLRNPFSRTQQDLTSIVLPTMPPAWTATPAPTPLPWTATPEGDQLGTPMAVQQQEYPAEVEAALTRMHEDQLDAAFQAWNEILAEDPDDHFSLAMRAHTRLRLLRGESSLSKFVNESLEAIADADQAIKLQPNQNGDYYLARAYGFENLSQVPGSRIDQDRYLELALENMLIGIALPHTNPTAYYGPPLFLLRLGRCDETLEQNAALLAARGEDAAPVPVLHEHRANALMCAGEYAEALEQIAIAIDVLPSCSYYFNRALMYYHSGAVDQALDEIDFTIERCPSFSGTRYYLRALIHAERGEEEQAVQDLLLGSFNTWEQAGLKAYVEGLLALDAGNSTQAIDSFKLAEQTMDRSHGPFVERIQAELISLGVTPVVLTPNPNPPSTPIPPLPEGHPTPAPETYVKYTTGAGEMRLAPGALHYFHFFAPQGFDKERVSNLKANLIGGNEGFPTELELLVHNPAMDYWHPFELVWGSNEIWAAGDYVNTSGDINIRIRNKSDEAIEFENFGITITVVTSGGTSVSYSYLDEG
jgi:tetratricopeptide (TPR) repeat protein